MKGFGKMTHKALPRSAGKGPLGLTAMSHSPAALLARSMSGGGKSGKIGSALGKFASKGLK